MFWRKKELVSGPTMAVPERALLGGIQEACTVFALQEGYLLRICNAAHMMPTVIYCKTAEEIGERLIAEQAKVKMGLSPTVTFRDHGATGAVMTGQSLNLKNVTLT